MLSHLGAADAFSFDAVELAVFTTLLLIHVALYPLYSKAMDALWFRFIRRRPLPTDRRPLPNVARAPWPVPRGLWPVASSL